MSIQEILKILPIPVTNYNVVNGGDINEAYCIFSNGDKYFLKLNDADQYPLLFEREAEGLTSLKKYFEYKVPDVISTGFAGNKQYLLLEWIEPGKQDPFFWENFGHSLAKMHLLQQRAFGWHNDNYIGSLQQCNNQYNKWSLFYAECRILPLVKKLFDSGDLDKKDIRHAETVCIQLENLYPEEPPSLLHGDLWSGNFMVSPNGNVTLFDPAVYCGHREMDIGMTMLFGGFDNRFYTAYNEVYPLETRWQQRLQLTQLYPLLVHALLFGGHYINSCRGILTRFSH